MGWIWESDSSPNPIIYRFENRSYDIRKPLYLTWAIGTVWSDTEYCIAYVNDTGQPMKIGNISIKTVSCHSGGQLYYAFGGPMDVPCGGYGADYTVYVRVSNDLGIDLDNPDSINSAHFEESEAYTNDIPSITSSNMNSPGTSSTNTAVFGEPPFTGDHAFAFREYIIQNCPVIQPGGFAFVHFRVGNFKIPEGLSLRRMTIRFLLNPREMIVDLEPMYNPYVWRYDENHEWHLVRPIQVSLGGNQWNNIEGDTE